MLLLNSNEPNSMGCSVLTKRIHQCQEYNATLRHVFFFFLNRFICIVIYGKVIMTVALVLPSKRMGAFRSSRISRIEHINVPRLNPFQMRFSSSSEVMVEI